MARKKTSKKNLKQKKKINPFLVVALAVIGFMVIEFFRQTFSFGGGFSAITGNAVADVGGLNPSYVLSILIFVGVLVLVIGLLVRFGKSNFNKRTNKKLGK